MKHILLILIRIYWAFVPASKRNTCLFNESCSNYVFNITLNNGLIKGIKALVYRYKNCRPGYQIVNVENETYMISVNREMFPIGDIKESIFK